MPRMFVLLVGLSLLNASVFAGENPIEGNRIAAGTESIPSFEKVYYIQIRVIFAGTTGIYGNVPRELSDMRQVLTKSFRYPQYEYSNMIRLSVFSNEEAAALVFPDHYIRLIPKGSVPDGKGLKLKAELYQAQSSRDMKTKIQHQSLPNTISIQEKENEGLQSPILPMVSSAFILTGDKWNVFGGIPVQVNTQGIVTENTLSTSRLNHRGVNQTLGQKKYLILGIRLDTP